MGHLSFWIDYCLNVKSWGILLRTLFIPFAAMSSYLFIIKMELPAAISEFLSGDHSG